MNKITLILGRDGMGDHATEADYRAWVDYVCSNIDVACGFTVDVDLRDPKDVQKDEIEGGGDAQRSIIEEAKAYLWDKWCER